MSVTCLAAAEEALARAIIDTGFTLFSHGLAAFCVVICRHNKSRFPGALQRQTPDHFLTASMCNRQHFSI